MMYQMIFLTAQLPTAIACCLLLTYEFLLHPWINRNKIKTY
jgi:hypothetical protein